MNLALACLLGGVISLALGAVWYSPKLFGKAWMAETGLTEEDAQKGNMPLIFGIAFLLSAYMAYQMKWINHPDEKLPAFLHGMFHGVAHVGLFGVGAIVINALFERKSFKYMLINGGYWVAVFALIGGTMTLFPSFKPPKAEEKKEGEDTGMKIESNEMDKIGALMAKRKDTYYWV